MDKKLPKVYANKVDKEFHNNERVYYSRGESGVQEEVRTESTNHVEDKYSSLKSPNVVQKIHSIFNSPRYVYKADVDIVLKSGTVSKKIIGQNSTHLITIDNELIPISDIVDIYFSE